MLLKKLLAMLSTRAEVSCVFRRMIGILGAVKKASQPSGVKWLTAYSSDFVIYEPFEVGFWKNYKYPYLFERTKIINSMAIRPARARDRAIINI